MSNRILGGTARDNTTELSFTTPITMRETMKYYGHQFHMGKGSQTKAIEELIKRHKIEDVQLVVQLERKKTRVFSFFPNFDDYYAYVANVPRSHRHFYPLDRSFACERVVSNWYCDIEWLTPMTRDAQTDKRLGFIKDTVKKMFVFVLGAEHAPAIEVTDFFTVDHTRTKKGKVKNSFHLHFPLCFEHNSKGCMYDFMHQMVFPLLQANELCTVRSDGEEDQFVVDPGVYTKNRAFRGLGSHKIGSSKTVPLPTKEDMRKSTPCESIDAPKMFPVVTEVMIAEALQRFAPEYGFEIEEIKATTATARIKKEMKKIVPSFPGAVNVITQLMKDKGDTTTLVVEDGDHYRGIAPVGVGRECLIAKEHGEKIVHKSEKCRITVSAATGVVTYMCFSSRGKGHKRIENHMSRLEIGRVPDAMLNRFRELAWIRSQKKGEIEGLDPLGLPLPVPVEVKELDYIPDDDLLQHMAAFEAAQHDELFDVAQDASAGMCMLDDLFSDAESDADDLVEVDDEIMTKLTSIMDKNRHFIAVAQDNRAKHEFCSGIAPVLSALVVLHFLSIEIKQFGGSLQLKTPRKEDAAFIAQLLFAICCMKSTVLWGAMPLANVRLRAAPYTDRNSNKCQRFLRHNCTRIKSTLKIDRVRVPDDHEWSEFVGAVVRSIHCSVSADNVVVMDEAWAGCKLGIWSILCGWLPTRAPRFTTVVETVPKQKKKKTLTQATLKCKKITKHTIPYQTLALITKMPPVKRLLAFAQVDFGWLMGELGFNDATHVVDCVTFKRLWRRVSIPGKTRIAEIDMRHQTNFHNWIGVDPNIPDVVECLKTIGKAINIGLRLSHPNNTISMIKL